MKYLILIAFLVIISESYADTYFSKQWALGNNGQVVSHDIGELNVKSIVGLKGADLDWISEIPKSDIKKNDIIVAVIDSGVDVNHPDLKNRIWFNEDLCKNLSIEEMEGKPCHGWNFLDANHDISDDVGHGTFVAGLISANKNDIGITGAVASNIKIMALKVQKKSLSSFVYKKKVVTNLVAEAIAFAIRNKADVINLSMGWPRMIHTKKVRFAIDQAIKANIPVVAASGNNGKNIPIYPCSYKGVICVGAMSNTGEMASFSNYGHKVDVMAPGEAIISTYPTDLESRIFRVPGYEKKRGTSFAAPFVSATLAVLKMTNPDLSLDEMKARLYRSRKDHNSTKTLFGNISQKNTVYESVKELVAPLLKDILEVAVTGSKFQIKIPIKSYVSDAKDTEIGFSFLNSDIKLVQSRFTIDEIKKNESQIIIVEGIVNLSGSDSSQTFKLNIKTKNDNSSYGGEVFLTRNIDSLVNRNTMKVKGVHPSKLGVFSRGRRVSTLRKVLTHEQESLSINYYVTKKSKKLNVVDILKLGSKSVDTISLKTNLTGDVLAVFSADYDLDGVDDYLVYELQEKEELINFSYFNADGSPLYKDKSLWSLKLSAFQALEFNAANVKFSLLKVKTKELGVLLVPAMAKVWSLPEEDNIDDFMFELPNITKKRQYYLLPSIGENSVELSIRTIESFDFVDKLVSELQLYDPASIQLVDVLKQTREDLKSGSVRAIYRAETYSGIIVFEMTTTSNKGSSVKQVFNDDFYLDYNTIYPIRDQYGLLTSRPIFAALAKRDEVRLTDGQGLSIEFITDAWTDPITRQVGNWKMDDDSLVSMVESRYNIHLVDCREGKQKIAKLPIYRDSSFPGVYFSETYKTYVKNEGKAEALLFMNSTQIFGNRLYSMSWNGESFSRPLNSSINIPMNCAFMDLNKLDGENYLTFMCKTKKGIELANYKY